jgi:hypothetical protein
MVMTMLFKWKFDTYMVVALIILPLLIVMLELQEEINQIKEEAKHQRKFVLDRYNVLQEKVNELSGHIEKKIVVDFSEFARENLPKPIEIPPEMRRKKKKKRRDIPSAPPIDLAVTPPSAEPTDGDSSGSV